MGHFGPVLWTVFDPAVVRFRHPRGQFLPLAWTIVVRGPFWYKLHQTSESAPLNNTMIIGCDNFCCASAINAVITIAIRLRYDYDCHKCAVVTARVRFSLS